MLLDTHVLVWAMMTPALLSAAARDALVAAERRCISAASLYEITFKARIGKWPEVTGLLAMDLEGDLKAHGFEIIPSTGAIMQRAGAFDWPHRDPFDRIIVATALDRDLTVLSKDATLDTIAAPVWRRVW